MNHEKNVLTSESKTKIHSNRHDFLEFHLIQQESCSSHHYIIGLLSKKLSHRLQIATAEQTILSDVKLLTLLKRY